MQMQWQTKQTQIVLLPHGKQGRPWSTYPCRSSMKWVCRVCSHSAVQTLSYQKTHAKEKYLFFFFKAFVHIFKVLGRWFFIYIVEISTTFVYYAIIYLCILHQYTVKLTDYCFKTCMRYTLYCFLTNSFLFS